MYNLFQLGLNEYKLGVFKQKVHYNHNSIFNKKNYYLIFGGWGCFFLSLCVCQQIGASTKIIHILACLSPAESLRKVYMNSEPSGSIIMLFTYEFHKIDMLLHSFNVTKQVFLSHNRRTNTIQNNANDYCRIQVN